MKITWLGQAGLLFETENLTVMIDPYFSDCCEKHNARLKRRIPIERRFIEIGLHDDIFARVFARTERGKKPRLFPLVDF